MSKKRTYILCVVISIPVVLITLASGLIEKITDNSGNFFLNIMLLLLVFGITTISIVVVTQRGLAKEELIRTAAYGFLWSALTLLVGGSLFALMLYVMFNNSHWAFG